MKSILFCIILILCFEDMQAAKNNELPIKVSIELPDTICAEQRDIPIILAVENITSEVLSIRNPAYWGNAFPRVKQGEKEIAIIKVRINPAVFKNIIQIKGNETLRIQFDCTLDKMLNLEYCPSGNYDLYFVLFLDEETSMKSDIVTFYIQW